LAVQKAAEAAVVLPQLELEERSSVKINGEDAGEKSGTLGRDSDEAMGPVSGCVSGGGISRQGSYKSGGEIRSGDRITYDGELGEVEFTVSDLTDDPAMDWYVEQYPGGGVTINTEAFGSVFLGMEDIRGLSLSVEG
jgi:hypothetical protein